MGNVFRDIDVGNSYDLKGSSTGRRTCPYNQNIDNYDRNSKKAMKDLDFLEFV